MSQPAVFGFPLAKYQILSTAFQLFGFVFSRSLTVSIEAPGGQ
jgi:hypothetical protein